MKYIYTLLFLATLAFAKAQITLIPDQEFEQDLINQNIDSDGIVNGQVFTNDIENLTDLTLFNNLTDTSGLQDFSQLKNLEIQTLYLLDESDQILDLTPNVMLEKLNMFGGDDGTTHIINTIDLSNNPNIYQIQTPGIWDLRQIDLKSGTTDVSNLDIDISVGFPLQPGGSTVVFNQNLFCIKVTDETAATAGTGVYSSWTITAELNPYYFSETCTLSTDRFNDKEVSIYPNPAKEVLNIQAKIFQVSSIKIYNLQGQLVRHIKDFSNTSIDISELARAMYIIHLESDNRVIKKKFLKQ